MVKHDRMPDRLPAPGQATAFPGRISRPWLPLFIALLVLSFVGCAGPPIGVGRVGLTDAYREMNASALNGKGLSTETKMVLQRYDLVERFDEDRAGAIHFIFLKLGEDDRLDLRFAIAEMCFAYAGRLESHARTEETARKAAGQPWHEAISLERGKNPGSASDYYFMAAVFAYQYLLGPVREVPPDAYDRRFRQAADLYNYALGKGLATGKEGQLEFREGVRELPIGRITISLKQVSLQDRIEDYIAFLPADGFAVHGLTVRNVTPGLGLPVVALHKKTPDLPRGPALPVTALLRFAGYERISADAVALTATLELYSAYDETEVTVGDRKVPLETDTTTPLAYKLSEAGLWSQLGIKKFISSGPSKPELILQQPYEPGRIPVVFVHGTASSPMWWAEMWNTLRSDPVVRKRFQFWFFTYNSSNPLVISASALRDSLSEEVQKLDPEGKDPVLREMVVIGHSQGGLLTKMTAVRSENRLWQSISDKSPDQLGLTAETNKLIKHYFFFDPLPFVKRVVFISTPHRGSYLTTNFVRNLIRKLVLLPADVVKTSTDFLLMSKDKLKLPPAMRGKLFTSVDAMSSDNPVLMALAELPVSPEIKANSIIAVKPDGDYRKGNDGVVEYTSAHLNGVESEFVVRSDHTAQTKPLTIEEVRRILLEHLKSAETGSPRAQALPQ